MFSCIRCRQLHNSAIFTPSSASGHIHAFPHAEQRAQDKRSQRGPSGDTFVFNVPFEDEWSVCLSMDTAESEWEQCHHHEPPGSTSSVVAECRTTSLFGHQQVISVAVCFSPTPAVYIILFITETPVNKSGQGYSGAPRIQRQEQVIHLSPKKSSQVRLCIRFLQPSGFWTLIFAFFSCGWFCSGLLNLW